jgi:hypothetical protein
VGAYRPPCRSYCDQVVIEQHLASARGATVGRIKPPRNQPLRNQTLEPLEPLEPLETLREPPRSPSTTQSNCFHMRGPEPPDSFLWRHTSLPDRHRAYMYSVCIRRQARRAADKEETRMGVSALDGWTNGSMDAAFFARALSKTTYPTVCCPKKHTDVHMYFKGMRKRCRAATDPALQHNTCC